MEGPAVEQSLTEATKRKPRHLFLFNDMILCTQNLATGGRALNLSDSKLLLEFKWAISLLECRAELQDASEGPPADDAESTVSSTGNGALMLVWEGPRTEEQHVLYLPNDLERQKWYDYILDARQVVVDNSLLSAKRRREARKGRVRVKTFTMSRGVTGSDNTGGTPLSPLSGEGDQDRPMDREELKRVYRDRILNLEKEIMVETKIKAGLESMVKMYENNPNKSTRVKAVEQLAGSDKKLALLHRELRMQRQQLETMDTPDSGSKNSSLQSLVTGRKGHSPGASLSSDSLTFSSKVVTPDLNDPSPSTREKPRDATSQETSPDLLSPQLSPNPASESPIVEGDHAKSPGRFTSAFSFTKLMDPRPNRHKPKKSDAAELSAAELKSIARSNSDEKRKAQAEKDAAKRQKEKEKADEKEAAKKVPTLTTRERFFGLKRSKSGGSADNDVSGSQPQLSPSSTRSGDNLGNHNQ